MTNYILPPKPNKILPSFFHFISLQSITYCPKMNFQLGLGLLSFLNLLVLGVCLINIWHLVRIYLLRRKHDIEYPLMWSDSHPDFNIAVGLHQNELANLPFFFILLACAVVSHTSWAVFAGWLFLIGRIVYSIGFCGSKPIWRLPGVVISAIFGILPLAGMCLYTAVAYLAWEMSGLF